MLPDRSQVVLRSLLEGHARATPDRTCAVFEDGQEWTYAEALAEAAGAAHALRARGVAPGDVVGVMLPNGPDFIRAWWGLALLGAVMAPVNTNFVGDILVAAVGVTGARVAVADATFGARLRDHGLDLDVAPTTDLAGRRPDLPPLERPIEPWDLHTVMLTSGTTGGSKGSRTPYHCSFATSSLYAERAGTDPRFLIDLPLFHIGGINPAYAMLMVGGSIAVVGRFAASTYLDRVRELGVTYTCLVGSIPAFLSNLPSDPGDAESPLRVVNSCPLPPDPEGFARRFGLDELFTAYGQTEVGGPFVSPPGRWDLELRPGYHARIVDEHDIPVPDGTAGELILRHDEPWALNAGYIGRDDLTAAAWQNGWFHTRDVFRRDPDGTFHFVDRREDVVRRRGENVSTLELEGQVLAHPAVAEVAAVGVPAPFGDQELRLFLVLEEGQELAPDDFVRWLTPRVPSFMVPRYVEISDALPKAPNLKVLKRELRARDMTDRTWDRQAAAEAAP